MAPCCDMTAVLAALDAVRGDGGGAGDSNYRDIAFPKVDGASVRYVRHLHGSLGRYKLARLVSEILDE